MQPLAVMNSSAAIAGRQWNISKELKDLGYKMRGLCPQNKSMICRVLLVFADINSISFISLALGLMRFLTSEDVSQNQFSWTNPSTAHCALFSCLWAQLFPCTAWIQKDPGESQRLLYMKWEHGESISDTFQVLGFAAFFALVLKKVEHEDEENTVIDGPLSAPGNCLQS